MSTGLRAGTNNDGYLQVNGTDVLTALSSGNVGIGTSTPNNYNNYNTLTINGTNGGEVDFEINGTLSADIFTNSTGLRLQTRTALPIVLSTHNGSNLIERLILTTDGNVRVPDNGNFTAGAGDDLKLYHNATNSYIENTTGDLYLQCTGSGDDIIVQSTDDIFLNPQGGNNGVNILGGGRVELYYNNSEKFRTQNTGVQVFGSLSVSQEYPSIRPTLDLNFAATKTLDRRVTFKRDSIGTYIDNLGILKYASNNVPRFDHNPTTGESLGLLIEESRTNILGLSSDLTDNNGTDWDAVNGTIAVNQTTAPDGTTTAASYTAAAGNAEHSVVFSELVPTGNSAASVWVKTNTYSIVSLNLYGQANSIVSYNLITKTVYNQGSNVSRATITEYPNGWYRISATMNCTVANSRVYRLYASTGNFNAGGSESFYYWGPQVESGNFETSYIPTYASNTSVTRAQDTAKITGTNFTDFYNQTEGTLVAHYYSTVDDGYLAQLENSATPGDDRIGFVNYAGYQGFVETGNSTQASLDNGTPTVGDVNKVAFAFKANDFAVSLNSASPSTDTSGTMPTVDRMMIGSRYGGAYDVLKSTIKQLTYYPQRLSNSQLQGLTQQ